MSLRFFGTDGIRGEYGSATLNDGIAYRAGRAAACVARSMLGVDRPQVIVGRDTRASGERLLAAFAQGVAREGGNVLDLGVAPTPAIAFAARNSDAHLACAITASHNPAKDNGIKFFQGDGVKPSEQLEQALDDMIAEVSEDGFNPDETVALVDASGLATDYASAIVAHFPEGLLAGRRVALDCANGAMSSVAPAVFRELGATVDTVAISPNGSNINDRVGSEHPESLGALYATKRYDIGFAFDGDGDRVILSDENGSRVPGEALLAALALDAKERDALPASTLVTTVQSNLGLDSALKERGIRVERTDVGDKHIARRMLANGFAVGGEESGHIVLGEFGITGDGLFAAVKLAELVCRQEQPISALTRIYAAFPQATKAVKVVAKPPISECPVLSACIERLVTRLGEEGRLLVRYSGTEPKLRLLVEAKTKQAVDLAMEELLEAVQLDLQSPVA